VGLGGEKRLDNWSAGWSPSVASEAAIWEVFGGLGARRRRSACPTRVFKEHSNIRELSNQTQNLASGGRCGPDPGRTFEGAKPLATERGYH
jgi:hypothetical protein